MKAPEQRELESLIIHTSCGLPVELCECPDAPVTYDSDSDLFVENTQQAGTK